ncbi:MAG: FAD-binding protein [Eggerthella lenta]
MGDAPQIEESDIVNTMETELLIVGAGNAGMAAAVLATDLGIDFVVAEKAAPWAQRATGTAR